MYLYIEILRIIAVLLITNSHLDGVYPIDISFGGSLGVALFFFVSGFLLNNNKIRKQSFIEWWIPKVIRVIVPLYIVHIVNALLGYRSLSFELLFPLQNNCWYVPAIIILYVVYYITIKYMSSNLKVCGLLCAIVYIFLYIQRMPASEFFVEPVYIFRYMYGYLAMLLGARMNKEEGSNLKGIVYLVLSILCIGVFLVSKVMINRSFFMMQIQFITQVVSVGFAYCITKSLYILRDCFENIKFIYPRIKVLIEFFGKRTLEIYLTQFAVISLVKGLAFPFNLVLIVVLTLFLAIIVNYLSNIIVDKLIFILRRRGII